MSVVRAVQVAVMDEKIRQDDSWVLAHEPTIQALVSDGERLLELGCGGRARDTAHLCSMASVVAVDLNAQALRNASHSVPAASYLCMDIGQPFPFVDGAFPVIVASLSLHYFSWEVTQRVVVELKRCLSFGGVALIRVNSTRDTNYGASSTDSIEDNFHWVDGQAKRFFDENAILALFAGWQLSSLVEMDIDRYDDVKRVWSFEARPESDRVTSSQLRV